MCVQPLFCNLPPKCTTATLCPGYNKMQRRLIARILTFRDKKYRILTFRDKKYRILTFRDKTESYLTVFQQNNVEAC